MKLHPKYLLITGLVGLFAWYFLMFAPMRQRLNAAEIEIGSVSSELTNLLTRLRTVPDQLRTDQGLDSLREVVNAGLYPASEIERLFAEFTDEAKNYGMTVTELTPAIEELLMLDEFENRPDSAPYLNFSARLTGRYIDFGKFMHRLETAPFFQGLNKVSIASPADPNDPLNFYVSIRALLRESGKKG